MYVQTPCNEPNSASPISDRAKARAAATLNWAANAMEGGNDALNALMVALHGNPIGSLKPGNAGVPTGNAPVAVPGSDRVGWTPRPGVDQSFPRYGPGSGFIPYPTFQSCRLPVVLPLETVQSFAKNEPVSTVVPPVDKSQPVATPAKLAECNVTSATICQALRDGCVLSSQVTPEQLFACSQAGWVGNRNLFPALAARGGAQGGKFFGSMNLSPDPPAVGVSGLIDDLLSPNSNATNSGVVALAVGLFGLGLWAVTASGKRGR